MLRESSACFTINIHFSNVLSHLVNENGNIYFASTYFIVCGKCVSSNLYLLTANKQSVFNVGLKSRIYISL